MLFARKGEQIFDADGKLYATVARDIDTNDIMQPDQLIFEDGKDRVIGEDIGPVLTDWWIRRRLELRGWR